MMRLVSLITLVIIPVALGASSSRAKLKSRFVDQLKSQFPRGVRVSVLNFRWKGDVPSSASLSIESPSPPVGIVRFRLTWVHQDRIQTTRGTALVKAYAKVAVAKAPIKNGSRFTLKNVSFKERDLGVYIHSGYFVDWKKLANMRARGYIRPGLVLGSANTKEPYSVRRNQTVELLHRKGSLRVSARVRALENGRIDDWIRVRNPKSKKVLHARVAGRGVVSTR